MKLIITNDDGIDAPGIWALQRAASELGETIVMAPRHPMSGVSHKVTTSSPLRVEKRDDKTFAIHGTPPDCARVALHHFPEEEFIILSGINDGGNLGVDIWHSGTVAAVREGVIHGRQGIALSHYHARGVTIDWERASKLVLPLLRDLLDDEAAPATFWNINLPNLTADDPDPEVVYCPVDPSPLPLGYREDEDELHYSGNYFERQREPNKDVDLCFGGKITISQLSLVR